MARPAVPRSHDRQGRRAARDRQRALLSRAPAPAARVRQPRRRGNAATAQGRVLSVYPATEGLSFKLIRSIIDAHLDALLAQLVTSICRPTCSRPRAFPASPTRCAWCIARRRSPRRWRGGRGSRSRSCSSCSCCSSAPRSWRASRAPASVREQARAHDEAARVAAVPAHRRAGARDARDRRRHVQRSPHAAAAAGRRRQRQDDRRAVRRAARDRERLSGGDHGADRAARRAARANDDAAARAARHRADSAHGQPAGARAQGDRRAAGERRAGARRRHARAGAGGDVVRASSASSRSTSSIASAWSSARRSAPRARRPTCC